MMFAGIDFGNQLAGTTCICFKSGNKLKVLQSVKKKKADAFLSKHILELQLTDIFIDAPLSLPLAYCNNTKTNYFFRACDKDLNIMSPMFLGGLTARAIKLTNDFDHVNFIEVHPSSLVKEIFQLNDSYKKDIKKFTLLLQKSIGLPFEDPTDWHQIDSILAWICGSRYYEGRSKIYGDPNEGLIYI